MKGLEAARRLYAEKGAAIIHEHFPEYEGALPWGLQARVCSARALTMRYLAITILSGFCLWLTDADDARIGIELSRKTRSLFGSRVSQASALGTAGVGVMRISDFTGASPGFPVRRKRGRTGCICLPTRSLRRSAARCSATISASFRAYGRRSPAECPRMFGAKACRAACSYGAVGAI